MMSLIGGAVVADVTNDDVARCPPGCSIGPVHDDGVRCPIGPIKDVDVNDDSTWLPIGSVGWRLVGGSTKSASMAVGDMTSSPHDVMTSDIS